AGLGGSGLGWERRGFAARAGRFARSFAGIAGRCREPPGSSRGISAGWPVVSVDNGTGIRRRGGPGSPPRCRRLTEPTELNPPIAGTGTLEESDERAFQVGYPAVAEHLRVFGL